MYGHALLKGGVAVFDELQQSIKRIEFLADPTAGEARIGTVEFLAGGLVFAAIDQLTRKYPRAAFHVSVTDGSPSLLHELRERKVEVALGRISTPFDDNDFDTQFLFDERLYVVTGIQSHWARRRKIRLAELIDEPWSLPPPDSIAGLLIADFFRANGLDVPRARVTSFSIQLHNSMLASGRVLAMIPGSFLHYSANRTSIKVLPVELQTEPRPVAVITLRNRTISPVAQLFIDCARECAKAVATKK